MWSVNGVSYNIDSDGQKLHVLIDLCTQLGFDIPRFCYHENLKIAGNCRMRLIEDSKAPKPTICCATNLVNDLSIYTNTVQVKKARESVMEFLPINHPLDCPICDQGGECDSQDLALVYGSDHGRFYDYKKNVEDKNCGPIIKTVMNRCILCTRCVRFALDVAGFLSFGLTGRGNKMEIGSYIEKVLDSEFSGNIADICPVGALTSKPHSFIFRPWETKKINFTNVLDDIPQLVRADLKEGNIIRILPSKNSQTNSWLTNRTRFSYEGLQRARALTPLIFGKELDWTSLVLVARRWLKKLDTVEILCKATSIFSFEAYNEILSNTDLNVIKNLLSSLGSYTAFSFKLCSTNILFLPSNILEFTGYSKINVFSVDMQFEMPLVAVGLKKHLAHLSDSDGLLLVTWRSNLTPLLVDCSVSLLSGVFNLIKMVKNKLWISLIFASRQVLTFCRPNFYVVFSHILPAGYFYFLASKNISERCVLDLDFTRFKNDSSTPNTHQIMVKGDNDHLFGKILTTLVNFIHCTNTDFLTSRTMAFLTPSRSIFEKRMDYTNIDYSTFVVSPVVTLSNNTSFKSTTNWIQLLTSLFGVRIMASSAILKKNSKVAEPLSVFTIDLISLYVKINLFTNKLISQGRYYSELSLTRGSPTLSLATNFNKHIY